MKQLAFILAPFWLFYCDTLHVTQNKHQSNTASLGVEWNSGDIRTKQLHRSIDSVLLADMDKFNSQKHAFSVFKRTRAMTKDYITIDIDKGKVAGTGGKIAVMLQQPSG